MAKAKKPTCTFDDEDGVCGEPANRRIVQRDDMGEAFCCEAHFIHFAVPGNYVYGLDGTAAPTFPPQQ